MFPVYAVYTMRSLMFSLKGARRQIYTRMHSTTDVLIQHMNIKKEVTV